MLRLAGTEREATDNRESSLILRGVIALEQIACTLAGMGGIPRVREDHSPVRAVGISIDDASRAWVDDLTSGGCTPGSISRMTSTLERVAESAGWSSVADVDYDGAVTFLAARRRGDNKSLWSGPTHDQAVSTLRVFGEFLRRSGRLATNPLMDLQACGIKGADGSRAITVEEARRVLAVSIDRHMVSRRARGIAPLFWLHQMYTGLRYSEAQSAKWRDYALEGYNDDPPAIFTDPEWRGNKGKRRERIPLHPLLLRFLKQHKERVPNGDADLVFPHVPTRETWHLEREAANIPKFDGRRRPCTPHSLRKSYCTWLDAMTLPRGLVSKLARHAETLTEEKYIDHGTDLEVLAIKDLPSVWPEGVELFSIRATKKAGLRPNPVDSYSTTSGSQQIDRMTTNERIQSARPEKRSSASGVVTSPNGPGRADSMRLHETESPRSTGTADAIQVGNGHFQPESTPTDEVVVRALARWLDRTDRGGSIQEPAHEDRRSFDR